MSPGALNAALVLALQWSPAQISGWLKQQFPTDRDMRISHEAIYRCLFVQTRGEPASRGLLATGRSRRKSPSAPGTALYWWPPALGRATQRR